MKKSLAALLVLVALSVPTLAGVMTTGPVPEPPPPADDPGPATAAYLVPILIDIAY